MLSKKPRNGLEFVYGVLFETLSVCPCFSFLLLHSRLHQSYFFKKLTDIKQQRFIISHDFAIWAGSARN